MAPETEGIDDGAEVPHENQLADVLTSWRAHFDRDPYMWLGAAFAAGFMLSGASTNSTGRVSRALRAQTESQTFNKFAGAMATVAVNYAKSYLDRRMPGFGDAFDRS